MEFTPSISLPLEEIIHSRRAQQIEEGRLRMKRDNALNCVYGKESRPVDFPLKRKATGPDHFKGAFQVKQGELSCAKLCLCHLGRNHKLTTRRQMFY